MPKFSGSTGDKAPAEVRNYAAVTEAHTVDAAASAKRQTFTAKILTDTVPRDGGTAGEAPMVAKSNRLKTS